MNNVAAREQWPFFFKTKQVALLIIIIIIGYNNRPLQSQTISPFEWLPFRAKQTTSSAGLIEFLSPLAYHRRRQLQYKRNPLRMTKCKLRPEAHSSDRIDGADFTIRGALEIRISRRAGPGRADDGLVLVGMELASKQTKKNNYYYFYFYQHKSLNFFQFVGGQWPPLFGQESRLSAKIASIR